MKKVIGSMELSREYIKITIITLVRDQKNIILVITLLNR